MHGSERRAARGLLDWSQQDLAGRAGLGIVTIRQIEADITEPRRATLTVLKQAFALIEQGPRLFSLRTYKLVV